MSRFLPALTYINLSIVELFAGLSLLLFVNSVSFTDTDPLGNLKLIELLRQSNHASLANLPPTRCL